MPRTNFKYLTTSIGITLTLVSLTISATVENNFHKYISPRIIYKSYVVPEELKIKYFTQRRAKLAEQLENNSILIIPSNAEQYRNGDNDFTFRQDSNFYYLSGFEEPESVLILVKNEFDSKFILFVRPNDPNQEQWQGKRAGLEGVKLNYLADESYDINDLDNQIVKLMQDKSVVYYDFDAHHSYDSRFKDWVNTVGHTMIQISAQQLVNNMRIIKDDYEQYLLTKASTISALAHNKVFRAAKKATYEYELEAEFIYASIQHGAKQSYLPIIGSGANSCILHYNTNDNLIDKSGVILIDAGAEYMNYSSDVTRTIPASGKFSPEQTAIYNIVLKAQLEALEQAVPGANFNMLNAAATRIITEGLVDLGIIKSNGKSIDELITQGAYRPFYMHSLGHPVGLDVHDVGTGDKNQAFKPGMVITIEPGIYIKNDIPGVDPKWLNIGVRVEDTVLITQSGNTVLSKDVPKTIEEIEKVMNS